MELQLKHPGWEHHEWDYYMRKNNYQIKDGDREFYLNGKRGVLTQDAPITKINFSEKMAAIVETQISSTEKVQPITGDEMDMNMQNIAKGFFNSRATGFDGIAKLEESAKDGLAALLPSPGAMFSGGASSGFGAGSVGGAAPTASTTPTPPKPTSAVATSGGTDAHIKTEAPEAPNPPKAAGKAAAAKAGAKRRAGLATSVTPGAEASTATGERPAAEAAQPEAAAPKRRAAGGGGGGGGNGGDGRGRKPRNYLGEFITLAETFKAAGPDSAIYFGSEMRVGMRQFEDLNKASSELPFVTVRRAPDHLCRNPHRSAGPPGRALGPGPRGPGARVWLRAPARGSVPGPRAFAPGPGPRARR